MFGMPGRRPIMPSTAPATVRARGCCTSCVTTCSESVAARDMRVTMTATAVDDSNAGICATRPSPIVNSV